MVQEATISRMIRTIMLFAISLWLSAGTVPAQTSRRADTLPLTTNSEEVRRLMEKVWDIGLDQVEQARAIEVLRKALEIDPSFAMGHELLSQISLDPAEQMREQEKAFATRSHASAAERLVIEWLQDAADHKLIPAITKMNDVLSRYPHDKWVVFLANRWLTQQTQYDKAIAVFENSGLNAPGLMNNTAYSYAYARQFEKSFALMGKYVAALPKDPNPQDSYAEILRMAGRFDQAIEHYRAALALDPDFYSSQFGIADTYSLMGDQVRARQEYAIGFKKFSPLELDRIQWQTREAITFVREGDYAAADRAFQAIADRAHAKHMSQLEADAWRQMAMYQRRPEQAIALLAKAQAAVQQGKNAMAAALQQELALILRARIEVALETGNKVTMASTLARLARMSENSNDKIIDSAYHGAAGAALLSGHKYSDAIAHLEEDTNNPFSLQLLAEAYQKTGDSSEAHRTIDTLTNFNDPTVEQALVVPAFRKCYQDPTCNSNLKGVSLRKSFPKTF
jgi:tetratricopeptide (TPR) repeat protein